MSRSGGYLWALATKQLHQLNVLIFEGNKYDKYTYNIHITYDLYDTYDIQHFTDIHMTYNKHVTYNMSRDL